MDRQLIVSKDGVELARISAGDQASSITGDPDNDWELYREIVGDVADPSIDCVGSDG